MTVPFRRPARGQRKTAFSLRQLVLFFGLVAIVLCAVGLTLKLIVRAAEERPATAVAVVAALVLAGAGLRSARRRRAAARLAEDLTDLTHHVASTSTAEEGLMPGPVPEGEDVPTTFAADDLAAMDPDSFEQAVAALCERDGCRDVEVVGGAGDLGADVIATTPDGRRLVMQCKRYGPMNKVGSQEVQRFGGTCFAVHEADVAAVVTTGEFTQPAAEYAGRCGIRCFDHQSLVAWTDGSGPAPWDTEALSPPIVPGPAQETGGSLTGR
ncbi:restriction system protein [Streptomyces pristinaespiralis]|jgi:restriction system protein|uniref:restriction endonuclease n=1 Tax=Streptomyces pristinaespiralis TaxID=38300 RepID=UPI0038365E2E